MKHNTASECIRTVAATYGCNILELYEHDANVKCMDTMRTAGDTPRRPVHAAYKTVDYQDEVFLRQSEPYMF